MGEEIKDFMKIILDSSISPCTMVKKCSKFYYVIFERALTRNLPFASDKVEHTDDSVGHPAEQTLNN
jgi:hypothetical protein